MQPQLVSAECEALAFAAKNVRNRQVRHACDQCQFLEEWRYYEAEETTADFDELRFLVCYMPLAPLFCLKRQSATSVL